MSSGDLLEVEFWAPAGTGHPPLKGLPKCSLKGPYGENGQTPWPDQGLTSASKSTVVLEDQLRTLSPLRRWPHLY